MKIEGNFKVFKHINAGRVNYFLAISVNDENEKFFTELGCRIAELAFENKSKTPKLKSLRPSDLELLRRLSMVSIRIYYMPGFTQKVVEW